MNCWHIDERPWSDCGGLGEPGSALPPHERFSSLASIPDDSRVNLAVTTGPRTFHRCSLSKQHTWVKWMNARLNNNGHVLIAFQGKAIAKSTATYNSR